MRYKLDSCPGGTSGSAPPRGRRCRRASVAITGSCSLLGGNDLPNIPAAAGACTNTSCSLYSPTARACSVLNRCLVAPSPPRTLRVSRVPLLRVQIVTWRLSSSLLTGLCSAKCTFGTRSAPLIAQERKQPSVLCNYTEITRRN